MLGGCGGQSEGRWSRADGIFVTSRGIPANSLLCSATGHDSPSRFHVFLFAGSGLDKRGRRLGPRARSLTPPLPAAVSCGPAPGEAGWAWESPAPRPSAARPRFEAGCFRRRLRSNREPSGPALARSRTVGSSEVIRGGFPEFVIHKSRVRSAISSQRFVQRGARVFELDSESPLFFPEGKRRLRLFFHEALASQGLPQSSR